MDKVKNTFQTIEDFPNYEIDIDCNIRNKESQKILVPFDIYKVDLYRDEGKTVIDKKTQQTRNVKTAYRFNNYDLLLKYHYYANDIDSNNFIIKHLDKQRLNCKLKNLKIISKTFFYINNEDGTFNYYNSFDKVFSYNQKRLPKYINKFHLFKDNENSDQGFIKYSEDFTKWNEEMKMYKLNFQKHRNHQNAVINTLKQYCPKELFKHEEILSDEALYINNSVLGALIFCHEGTCDCFGYDIKSAYPSIMSQSSFKIPSKSGHHKHIDELPEKLEFGFYKVIILSNHPHVTKIFRFNEKNIYTHSHIMFVRKYQELFNFSIQLIHEKNNCYVYDEDCLINGDVLFKKWYDILINIKNNHPKNKLIKHLLSSAWGSLSRTNYLTKDAEEDFTEIIGDGENEFTGYEDATTCKFLLKNNRKPFLYNIRLKPFLKAAINNIMGHIMIKHGVETIMRVHTDGFVTTKEMTFKVENLMNDEKYTGHIKFTNIQKHKTY